MTELVDISILCMEWTRAVVGRIDRMRVAELLEYDSGCGMAPCKLIKSEKRVAVLPRDWIIF